MSVEKTSDDVSGELAGKGSTKKVDSQLPPLAKLPLDGLAPLANRRKFSFPASFHSNLLALATERSAAKRRFSNVGDVVTRKLSTTIGWRTVPVPIGEVVSVGRALCGRYVRARVRRAGLRVRRVHTATPPCSPAPPPAALAWPGLLAAATELERMHPRLYTAVTRQACGGSAGVLVSEKAAVGVLASVGRELLAPGQLTWGRLVAVYAVAGGLAVDCVCHGRPDFLQAIVEATADLLEDDVAEWIAAHGGWNDSRGRTRTAILISARILAAVPVRPYHSTDEPVSPMSTSEA